MRATRNFGRASCKRWAGNHIRSRIEAKIRGLKSFGERIAARNPDRRTADIKIRVALTNRLNVLGAAEIVHLTCINAERGSHALSPLFRYNDVVWPKPSTAVAGRSIGFDWRVHRRVCRLKLSTFDWQD